MSPLTGFPSGPASPLSPGRPWSKRWRQGRGQCQAGAGVSARQGNSAVPTGAPSLPFSPGSPRSPPRATFTLQGGQAQGHRTDRDLPITSQGLLTSKEGCAQQCLHPGLCSLLTLETYNLRPYLLWVPARPRLLAHPVLGRRQMPSALADPLYHHHPQSQLIMLPQLGCLVCPSPFRPATHLRSLGSDGAAFAWEAHQAALHHVHLWAGRSQGQNPGDLRKVPSGAKPSPSPCAKGLDVAIHPQRGRLAP